MKSRVIASLILIFLMNISFAQKKKNDDESTTSADTTVVTNFSDIGNIGLDMTTIASDADIQEVSSIQIPTASTQSASSSTTITLQPGPGEGKDAALIHEDAYPYKQTTNYGAIDYTQIKKWTGGGGYKTSRGLIEFDLAFLSDSQDVENAKLSLYFYGGTTQHGGGDISRAEQSSFYLRRVTEEWEEGTVTWDSQPTATPINQVAVDVPQGTASLTADFIDIDVTQLVKDMIENGNNGFQLILQTESTFRLLNFGTSENTNDNGANRPKLEITHTGGTTGGAVSSVNGQTGDVVLNLSNSISGTNRTIDITGSGIGTTINVADNDNDSSNEIQTFDVASLNGSILELSLSGDGQSTKEIDLSTIGGGTADNLGDHSATQNIKLNGKLLSNNGTDGIKIDDSGNIGINTNPDANYVLSAEGKIRAREVLVETTNWADFVFSPSYKLKSLTEVEQFIKTNGHLPDIPSEVEVKQNGMNVGEINSKLLQKIEELTLYIIKQQKEIEELKDRTK